MNNINNFEQPRKPNTKIKCYGISNSFHNDEHKIFFNEYDNYCLLEVLEEQKYLSKVYGIDIYRFLSSPEHYHLVSLDILDLEELKTIINNCTNNGDYLYNFYDRNYDYVLRLSEKDNSNLPRFEELILTEKNKHYVSMQHLKAYRYFLGSYLPVRTTAKYLNLNTKIVVYQTNRRKS